MSCVFGFSFGVVSHRNHISMNVCNTSRVDLAELYISSLTLICFPVQLFSGKKQPYVMSLGLQESHRHGSGVVMLNAAQYHHQPISLDLNSRKQVLMFLCWNLKRDVYEKQPVQLPNTGGNSISLGLLYCKALLSFYAWVPAPSWKEVAPGERTQTAQMKIEVPDGVLIATLGRNFDG